MQNRYALDSRAEDADDVLDACREQGIAFVPFFAIAGTGREQGAAEHQPDEVAEIARTSRHPGPGPAGLDGAPRSAL